VARSTLADANALRDWRIWADVAAVLIRRARKLYVSDDIGLDLANNLSRQLARHAEAVCRYYLPNGRRGGRYWLTGDVHDTPGRSLYVRLAGPESGPGAAGHWTDGDGEVGRKNV
jgi:hypothetical protein